MNPRTPVRGQLISSESDSAALAPLLGPAAYRAGHFPQPPEGGAAAGGMLVVVVVIELAGAVEEVGAVEVVEVAGAVEVVGAAAVSGDVVAVADRYDSNRPTASPSEARMLLRSTRSL